MSEEMNWQIVGYMAALQFRAEQAELIVNEEYSDLGYRPGHGIRTYKEIAKELEAERTLRKEAESERDTLQARLDELTRLAGNVCAEGMLVTMQAKFRVEQADCGFEYYVGGCLTSGAAVRQLEEANGQLHTFLLALTPKKDTPTNG
jgi:hypothetical protein